MDGRISGRFHGECAVAAYSRLHRGYFERWFPRRPRPWRLAAGPKRAWIGRTITTLEDTPIPPAADPPGTTTPGPVDGLWLRWWDPGASDEYIVGGWWPRSLDLSTEFPPLRRGDVAREVLMLRAREDMVMPVGPAPHPTLANLVEHRPDAGAARCHRAEHFLRPGRAAARGGAASLTSSRCSGSGDEPPEHWPMARFSSKQARRTAARDLLAASQAARRALEVMTVYEREHGDELLSR